MAEVTTIQMHGVTSADATASIDIPADGVLVGIDWAGIFGALDTVDDQAEAELSFNSTNQRTTNDARAAISSIKMNMTGLTSGFGPGAINKFVDLKDGLPVMGGERIYMHVLTSAGVTVNVSAILYFRFRSVRRAATRRR